MSLIEKPIQEELVLLSSVLIPFPPQQEQNLKTERLVIAVSAEAEALKLVS